MVLRGFYFIAVVIHTNKPALFSSPVQHIGHKAITASEVVKGTRPGQQVMEGFIVSFKGSFYPAVPFQYRAFVDIAFYDLFPEIPGSLVPLFFCGKFFLNQRLISLVRSR